MYTRDIAPIDSHVFSAAITTTHTVYAIPAEWSGRKVIFTAYGANVFILFGFSAAMEVDRTAFSSGTPPAITVNAKTGLRIPQNGAIEVNVPTHMPLAGAPTAVTHFAVEADADVGYWQAVACTELT